MSKKLSKDFYLKPAYDLARDLLGKIIVHKNLKAKIVETEAYVGDHDMACHSFKGRTKRTDVMFLEGGRTYIYLIYGIHELFNIVCSSANDPQAVLIRAAEPINFKANLSGPGLFSKGMRFTRTDNNKLLTGSEIYLLEGNAPSHIIQTPRIGVSYSKVWADVPLRFLDGDSPYISSPKAFGNFPLLCHF